MSETIGYLALGVSLGLVYGLLALGIVLVYKGSRVINFAHPYLALLCAFITWWFTARASFLPFEEMTRPRFVVASVLGLALIGLNGFGIEHGLIRRLRNAPRLTLLVATIALAQGTLGVVLLLFNRNDEQAQLGRTLPSLIPQSVTFHIGNFVIDGRYLQIFIAVPLIAAGLGWFFTRTKFGVGVRAAAENRDAARLLGISADRVSIFTWVAGSLLAGVAALLIVPLRGLDVSVLSTGFLVRALAAALIGGLTSLPGALVGGVAIGVTESILGWRFDGTPGLPETMMFVAVVGFLLFRPGGLFGRPEETEDKVAFVSTLRELPARVRLTPVASWFGRFWWFTAIVFSLAISQVVGAGTNDTLVRVTVYGMVGVSLTVLMGYSGQISLGHWGLVGVGALATATLFSRFHVPFLITLPSVVLIGMVVSLVIGLPALRIRGLYLAVVTLAFNLAAEFFLFKQSWLGGTSAGIIVNGPKLGPLDLDAINGRGLFPFALACLLLSIWVARNLSGTRTGRGFFALRENEKAAATLGVELTRYKLLSFAISGGMAALAGCIYSINLGNVTASAFPTAISLVLVAMVVIGGLGSVEGAVLGALLVFGLPDLIHFKNLWIVPIGSGILLFMVITRAPGGIAGLLHLSRRELVTDLVELREAERPSTSVTGEATVTKTEVLTRQ